MNNNDADVTVTYDTNVNEETVDNNSDSTDIRGNNSDLGENAPGNAIGAGSQLKEKPEKLLLPYDAPTYGLELPTCTKNAMIIFNQENFVNPHRKRVGSEKDVKALTETFEQFKFEVTTYKDYKKKDLLETLKGFWKRNYDAYGCVCVALLTHGNKGELEASDTEFPESQFFECFDIRENNTLAGKPIIIIVQACRGKDFTVNIKVELAMKGDEDNQPKFMYLPTHSNILVFRSCYSNTASTRDPEKGGLFIRSLCRQIKETPGQDFEYICVQVKREVAEKFNPFHKNQMPVVTSTLIKKLLLEAPGPNAELQGYDQDPRRMPPTYFLQYFHYIDKCLRLYLQRKQASSALTDELTPYSLVLEGSDKIATNDTQAQLAFIRHASSYLKDEGSDKSHGFPELDFVYFHYHE